MNKLHILCASLLPLACVSGETPGDAQLDPDVLIKSLNAIHNADLPGMRAVAPTDQEPNSYHLVSAHFCGSVTRFNKTYHAVSLFFIRSSNIDSEFAPAKGHGFLVILDAGYAVVSHARLAYADYRIDRRGRLMYGDDEVLDFFEASPAVRRDGWLVDGNGILPYPFDDKITGEH